MDTKCNPTHSNGERNLFCHYYSVCLYYAVKNSWHDWDCSECQLQMTHDEGVNVKVGRVPHSMEEKHYIEWIEIIEGDNYCRQFLKPGQAPAAPFASQGSRLVAREYCNIHGLWKS